MVASAFARTASFQLGLGKFELQTLLFLLLLLTNESCASEISMLSCIFFGIGYLLYLPFMIIKLSLLAEAASLVT